MNPQFSISLEEKTYLNAKSNVSKIVDLLGQSMCKLNISKINWKLINKERLLQINQILILKVK